MPPGLPWPNSRTLRGRFAWRAGLITLLLSVTLGLGTGFFWEAQVREAIRDGVTGHLRALEAELDLAPESFEPGSRPMILPAPEQFVQVVGLDGRVIAASSELAAAEPLIDITGFNGEGFERVVDDPRASESDALVMASQIDIDGGTYIGIVGASLERVAANRRLLLWLVGLGAPALAVLIATGVWMSVSYALKPVQLMAAEADRLAAGRGPWKIGVEPDTEELVLLSDRLAELLAHIRQTFDRERQFLDDASHELRTPIAVARAELDLARGQVGDDAEAQAALRSSIEELDHLDRLAADLLVMARARGGDRTSIHPCDLAGIARHAVAGVMRKTDRPEVRAVVRGAAEVIGDPGALERAFVNVVANAVDHADSEVEVALSAAADHAVVEVTDDGPGFPPDVLDRALDRFFRAQDRRQRGTGLGLAIAADIVAAHDGTLGILNLEDGGARVTIRLPREVDRAHGPRARKTTPRPDAHRADRRW